MDIATGLGLLGGAIVVSTIILMGGSFGMYFSDHAIIIIFGGSFSATLIRFPLSSIFHGLPLGAKFAFTMRRITQRELVDQIAQLAEVARKSGPVGLEKVEVEDPFLGKGIRYIADGYDTNFIRDNLERDRDNFLTHLDEGQKIYRAIGDCAPAFGMIGTLLGMVQMFANMTDPSKLGPFMATALLATLYGAVVANLWCLPLADKLHLKLAEEEINRTLIIDGVLMIREAKSPTLVREMLLAYLPEKRIAATTWSRRRRSTAPGAFRCNPTERRASRGPQPWRKRKQGRTVVAGTAESCDLRRPDGPAGRLLRDAGRLLDPGSGDQLNIVARSMRDAFGVQDRVRYSGVSSRCRACRPRPKLKRHCLLDHHARRSFRDADAR